MTAPVDSLIGVAPHGKFFQRGEHKFFLKAVRLDNAPLSTNFNQKLGILEKLEELKGANTNALLLKAEHADQMIEIAAIAGLYTLAELDIEPHDLVDRHRRRAAGARFESDGRMLAGRAGLLGYVINCALDQSFVKAYGIKRIRDGLRALLRTLRSVAHAGCLLTIHLRDETRALALDEEDIIFSDVSGLSGSELSDYLVTLHNLADSRPVLVEFTEPGQRELLAAAFSMGAAGVVAPLKLESPSAGVIGINSSIAEPPFSHIDGESLRADGKNDRALSYSSQASIDRFARQRT